MWDKGKFWVSMRSRTSGLQIPHFNAQTTKPQGLHSELILAFSQNLLITFSCNDCYGKLFGLLLFSSRIFFLLNLQIYLLFYFKKKMPSIFLYKLSTMHWEKVWIVMAWSMVVTEVLMILVNPLTSEISPVILLTVCYAVLGMLVLRIWYWINK